jgi:transposase
MLRKVRAEGVTVTEAAAAFGMSRFSFYQAQAAFEEGGLPGLTPKRPGPRRRHKLTPEVLTFVQEELAKKSSLEMRDLLQRVQERFGLMVHPRTVERALADSKKNRRQWRSGRFGRRWTDGAL